MLPVVQLKEETVELLTINKLKHLKGSDRFPVRITFVFEE